MVKRKLFLFLIVIASVAGNDEVLKVMKELEIIPDVIDNPPNQFLKVIYPGNVMVNEGNELTPTQVKDEPIIEWTADANKYYLVLMVAPDAPYRQNPYMREWLHWLVVNIPGTDIVQGEILCPYIGAGVPKSGGLARFVFLVYQQTEYMVFDEEPLTNMSVEGHSNFSTKNFAEKYGLEGPLAGNVFQARWDEYVPILFEQLHVEL